MTELSITEVTTKKDIEAFIDLPWKIYAGYEHWVPPIKSIVRQMLDTRRHPFWEFSERALFLAKRGNEPAGRIAAIVDGNFNERYDVKTGVWGFFECENDQDTASALFLATEDWLRSKGMENVIGPLNPSLNYEAGLLIEGFENQPMLMMTYNPPYYLELIEHYGHQKRTDLYSLYFPKVYATGERVRRLSRRMAQRQNITIRPFNIKKFNEDMNLLREAYNEIWSDNWGFVPATEAEAVLMAKEFRLIGDPDLVFFIYSGDELAGVSILMPDVNPILKRLNGRIGIKGAITFLLHRKKVEGIRGMVLGFKKKFRGRGYVLVVVEYVERVALAKGYRYMELGWNLEDNKAINQFELEMGGSINNRYRIFEKAL